MVLRPAAALGRAFGRARPGWPRLTSGSSADAARSSTGFRPRCRRQVRSTPGATYRSPGVREPARCRDRRRWSPRPGAPRSRDFDRLGLLKDRELGELGLCSSDGARVLGRYSTAPAATGHSTGERGPLILAPTTGRRSAAILVRCSALSGGNVSTRRRMCSACSGLRRHAGRGERRRDRVVGLAVTCEVTPTTGGVLAGSRHRDCSGRRDRLPRAWRGTTRTFSRASWRSRVLDRRPSSGAMRLGVADGERRGRRRRPRGPCGCTMVLASSAASCSLHRADHVHGRRCPRWHSCAGIPHVGPVSSVRSWCGLGPRGHVQPSAAAGGPGHVDAPGGGDVGEVFPQGTESA